MTPERVRELELTNRCVRCSRPKDADGVKHCRPCLVKQNKKKAAKRCTDCGRQWPKGKNGLCTACERQPKMPASSATPPTRRERLIRPAPILQTDHREFYVVFNGT